MEAACVSVAMHLPELRCLSRALRAFLLLVVERIGSPTERSVLSSIAQQQQISVY